jgi:hypothetical protein
MPTPIVDPEDRSSVFSADDVAGLVAVADALETFGVEGDVPEHLRHLAGRIAQLLRKPSVYRGEQ